MLGGHSRAHSTTNGDRPNSKVDNMNSNYIEKEDDALA